MDRRTFLSGSAALAGALPLNKRFFEGVLMDDAATAPASLDIHRHRFGVNYTPSRNWWFCWNDWNSDPIKRDLDAIAALGADHLRVLLIWPYFQPNPAWVSAVHLDRLSELLTLMGERKLDALVTAFTGQLSGWYFLPPFNAAGEKFFTDPQMRAAQALYLRELARRMATHENVIGFDLGNEINTCWAASTNAGDAWMSRAFAIIESALPGRLNVNGVDEQPWFQNTTFSPRALIADQRMPVMHCYPWWTGALKYGGPMDPPSVKLLAAMAALIRSYAGDHEKPVWAGEFNTCIESLSEKQQAKWLEQAVVAAIDEGVSWFSYWDSHDVERRFKFNSLEYTLGLLTNDGRVKEQGRMFRELAETYRGKAVVFPRRTLPPPPAQRSTDETWRWMLDWMGWHPTAG